MNTKGRKIRSTIMLVLMLCGALSAQAADYVFRNMTGRDGLSGLLINTIYKDKQGYIWLGTDNGLDRFDGMRVRNYTFDNVAQTMKKRVNCVAVTASGRLFAGNGLGLWAENGQQGRLQRRFNEQINFSVNALLADGETLYAGTDKGLYTIKKDDKPTVNRADAKLWAAANKITRIVKDSAGQCLWLTTQDGLARYDLRNGRMSMFRIDGENADNYLRCAALAGQDLYVGTMTQGLFVFNIKTHSFKKGPQVGSNVISDMQGDGRDMVYVATDGNGVHFVSHRQGKVTRSFQHTPGSDNSISSNSVYSLHVDGNGMMWVGTYRTGLDYTLHHKNLFSLYAVPPAFTTANLTVNSTSTNGRTRVVGTRDGLFFINELTGYVVRFTTPQLTSNLILSTAFHAGKYYIGTYGGGLLTLDPTTMTLTSFGGQLARGHVFCLRTDKNGLLWIGTDNGLCRYDAKTQQLFTFNSANSQMHEGAVYAVTFDSTGKGWVGTEAGLCVLDPVKNTIRTDVFPEGFANKDKIRCIFEDSRHNIFFVREKGNLFVSNLTMDKFGDVKLPFMRQNGDNSVLSVIEDHDHYIWLACSDGLFRMANVKGEAYDLFTFSDGLPSQTFTNSSAALGRDGTLWIGNAKGLVSINPATLAERKTRRLGRVLITGVQVDGKETGDYRSLPNGSGTVSFFFSDMSFSSPLSAVYEYRLDGVDSDWQTATATAQALYYNLGAGSYTFHVRTPGNAATETTVEFTIRPLIPWWGWTLIAIAIAAFVIIIIRRRKTAKAALLAAEANATQDETQTDDAQQTATAKVPKVLLTDKECEMVRRRITVCMEKERLYTNKNLKSVDLATAVSLQPNLLSFVLNQYMHVSFNDFVNEYRVHEFKRKAANGRYNQVTLSALASECGFGSHASFFRTFKKITGITPNEYLHKVQTEEA